MKVTIPFLTDRAWTPIALAAVFSVCVGTTPAQTRLSGVPSADEIANALARPAGTPASPKIRTRGLKLDAAAETETAPAASAASAPAKAAASPSQDPKEAADSPKRSSILMAGAAQKPAAPRAVDLEITFAFGSDQLTAEGRSVLDQLGKALHSEALADVTGIVLEGHTDAVGSATSNRALSLRRAISARQYLAQRHRINPSAIQTVGKGASELADPSNPAGEVNRRVRVVVES